jgi:hypothetical protein
MNISGKEDTATMDFVTAWWQGKLAEEKCWAVVDVPGQLKELVYFENRLVRDHHAASCCLCRFWAPGVRLRLAMVRNLVPSAQLWWEGQTVQAVRTLLLPPQRLHRHRDIHPSILPIKSTDVLELGAQPACYAMTVEASREVLQPLCQQQQTVAKKTAGAESKALGGSQGCITRGGTKMRGRATQSGGAAKQPHKANPLDKSVRIFVHPEVKDEIGLQTHRLPPPSRPCTIELNGVLLCRWRVGCEIRILPPLPKARQYVWTEINPVRMEHGTLKSEWDREFLQMRCRDILSVDGCNICESICTLRQDINPRWVFI